MKGLHLLFDGPGIGDAGDVAAGSRQGRDNPGADRVPDGRVHHRYVLDCFDGGLGGFKTHNMDHVDLVGYKFFGGGLGSGHIARGILLVVGCLDTGLFQGLGKTILIRLESGVGIGDQHPDGDCFGHRRPA